MGRILQSEVDRRLAEARALISSGVTIRALSERWGIQREAAKQFLRRHRVKGIPRAKGRPKGSHAANMKIVGNEPSWQNADPAALTDDQKDAALRMGISLSRMAWLLQCPKGGNAVGWSGGNSIG